MNRCFVMSTILLAACGKDSSSPRIQPLLSIVAGDGQVDTVGKTLPVQVGAKLTDALSGAPLSGRMLDWVAVDGGSLFVPATQTGSDGIARNTFTLGPHAGTQRVVARYVDPETGAPVTLDTAQATALAAVAALLWANKDPGPYQPGIAHGISVRGAELFSLYYGFLDGSGNRTAVCGPITWTYFGNGGFPDDTISAVGSPVALDNNVMRQDFIITGPGASGMDFLARATCVQESDQAFFDHSDIPVGYQP
jgi:hypothetical protein